MGRTLPWRVLAAVLVVACGDDLPTQGTTSVAAASSGTALGGSADTGLGSTGPIPPGPPEIIDLGKDVLSISEGEGVTLTAFVRDPNGDDDIVRGVLLGPGEPEVYGELQRGANGHWRITITWDDVHTRWPLDFTDSLMAMFTARFEDTTGLVGERSTLLDLRCGGLSNTACDGSCVNLEQSAGHCGACLAACPVMELTHAVPVGGCDQGRCLPVWSGCAVPTELESCDEVCAVEGRTCVPWGCQGTTVLAYTLSLTCEIDYDGAYSFGSGCSESLSSWATYPYIRCCCDLP